MNDQEMALYNRIQNDMNNRFSQEVSEHRTFLEILFNKVMWAVALIVVVMLGIGSLLFNNSLDIAATKQVQVLMDEKNVARTLSVKVDQALAESDDKIQRIVENKIDEIANGNEEIKEALKKRLHKIKNQSIESIISTLIDGNNEATDVSDSFNMEVLIKTGNNGTVSCDQYCTNAGWHGFTGTCVGAKAEKGPMAGSFLSLSDVC